MNHFLLKTASFDFGGGTTESIDFVATPTGIHPSLHAMVESMLVLGKMLDVEDSKLEGLHI